MSLKVYKTNLGGYSIKGYTDKTYDQLVKEQLGAGPNNDDFLKFVAANYGNKIPNDKATDIIKANFDELAKAAACKDLHNTDTVAPEVISGITQFGVRIDKWVKFGKSRKTYKSIKIPKYLLGNVKFKKPPAPSMQLMQIINFIWALLDTGAPRAPSLFIRMGMGYLRDLGNIPSGPIMTTDYTRILGSLDKQIPGLLVSFKVWKKASAEWKKKVIAAQAANKEKKNALLASIKNGFQDQESSFANFVGALQGIGANLITDAVLTNAETIAMVNQTVNPNAKSVKSGKASVFTLDVSDKGPIISKVPVGTDDTTMESVLVKKDLYKKPAEANGDYFTTGAMEVAEAE